MRARPAATARIVTRENIAADPAGRARPRAVELGVGLRAPVGCVECRDGGWRRSWAPPWRVHHAAHEGAQV